MWPGSRNWAAYTPASGGSGGTLVLPGAPGFVQEIFEGQTGWGQSVWQTSTSDFQPQSQNYIAVGLKLGTPGSNPIASLNSYRTENQGQAPGSFPAYQTGASGIAVATLASNFASLVSSSTTLAGVSLNDDRPAGGWPIPSLIDSLYIDTAAGTATGYPAGGGPSFYQGNGWCYEFSCVDSLGNEGPRSAPMVSPYFVDGQFIMSGGTFNGTLVNADTTGGTTPLGYAHSVLWQSTGPAVGGNNLINPFAGYGSVRWNKNIRQHKYLNLAIKPHQSGGSLQILALRIGDHNITVAGGNGNVLNLSSYGTYTTNAWTVYKVPLVDLMTDVTLGQQQSLYKFDLIETNGLTINFSLEIWFSPN